MKIIKQIIKQLRLWQKLKKGVINASVILGLLSSNACVKTVATNNICLWVNKIRLLEKEIGLLSEESARQIDDHNSEIDVQCNYLSNS